MRLGAEGGRGGVGRAPGRGHELPPWPAMRTHPPTNPPIRLPTHSPWQATPRFRLPGRSSCRQGCTAAESSSLPGERRRATGGWRESARGGCGVLVAGRTGSGSGGCRTSSAPTWDSFWVGSLTRLAHTPASLSESGRAFLPTPLIGTLHAISPSHAKRARARARNSKPLE
jgi:hypothetical protein